MKAKKTALIVGATGGIGKEISKQLHKDGYELYLVGRKFTTELKRISYAAFECEFLDDSSVYRCIQEIKKEVEKIDVLINCAGVFQIKNVHETSVQEFRDFMKINVEIPYTFIKEFSRKMVLFQSGKIINIGSSSCYGASESTSLYSCSKHALLGLSRALYQEFKTNNVRVFCVSPGSTQTEMAKVDDRQDFKTFLEPRDIAKYVSFVLEFDSNIISEEIRLNRVVVR